MTGRFGWIIAGVLAVALVGGWFWHDQRAGAWATDRSRIQGQVDAQTAAAKAATRRADSLAALATQAKRAGDVARARADSLAGVVDQLTAREDSLERQLPTITPPACQVYADALAACKARGDALAASLAAADSADNAHVAALAQATAALGELRSSLRLAETSRDSLRALTGRAPGACKIPLLGLRCPVLGAGYTWMLDRTGRISGGIAAGGMIPLVGGR